MRTGIVIIIVIILVLLYRIKSRCDDKDDSELIIVKSHSDCGCRNKSCECGSSCNCGSSCESNCEQKQDEEDTGLYELQSFLKPLPPSDRQPDYNMQNWNSEMSQPIQEQGYTEKIYVDDCLVSARQKILNQNISKNPDMHVLSRFGGEFST